MGAKAQLIKMKTQRIRSIPFGN